MVRTLPSAASVRLIITPAMRSLDDQPGRYAQFLNSKRNLRWALSRIWRAWRIASARLGGVGRDIRKRHIENAAPRVPARRDIEIRPRKL
jgi:hypothetical protein